MNFIFLTILLVLWISWIIYRDHISPKWRRKRQDLKQQLKNITYIHFEENSHLSYSQQSSFLDEIKEIKKEINKNKKDLLSLKKIEENIHQLAKKYSINYSKNYQQAIRSFIITIVVILILRNFFLMPFVIPTGSMQPTLHGINYYHAGEKYDEITLSPAEKPVKVQRMLEALFFGRSYVDSPLINFNSKITNANTVDIVTNLLGIPFLQNFITVYEDDKKHFFPGTPDTLRSAIYNHDSQKNQHIKGHVEVGDFLLVNRWSYYFCSPKRGDIIVFSTSSLKYHGKKLQGVFYVKRLIGIGGDTIRIDQKNQTWIKPYSTKKFIKLQTINSSLKKLFSHRGGYGGHTREAVTRQKITTTNIQLKDGFYQSYNFEGQIFIKNGEKIRNINKNGRWSNYQLKENDNELYLVGKNDKLIFRKQTKDKYSLFSYEQNNGYKMTVNNNYNEYYIPKGYYFTLGDNTKNSLDSRFWGVVPQKELIGKPLVIFWPFSRRWGRADKEEVLNFTTR